MELGARQPAQLEQDQRAVLSAAQPAARESAWARAGRLDSLRRNE